jgi:hypothetical protein
MKHIFKKDNFTVVKKAIDPKIANFVYNYFLMKRQVAQTMHQYKFVSPFETMLGVWNDAQAPNTYSNYGDIAMDTLLLLAQGIMEKHTGLKLIPTYSYARIYKKGDELIRHKDRFSCEISTTLNLGGDQWPIFIAPLGKENKGGIKVNLNPGDMLIYRGNILEHWREPFTKDECCQVFLHYNNENTPNVKDNMFDGRKHLGLPDYTKDIF